MWQESNNIKLNCSRNYIHLTITVVYPVCKGKGEGSSISHIVGKNRVGQWETFTIAFSNSLGLETWQQHRQQCLDGWWRRRWAVIDLIYTTWGWCMDQGTIFYTCHPRFRSWNSTRYWSSLYVEGKGEEVNGWIWADATEPIWCKHRTKLIVFIVVILWRILRPTAVRW